MAATMSSRSAYQYQSTQAPASGAPTAPPGTFAPGTKVQVGTHRVVIQKYLSEGGFAHVYVVRISSQDRKDEIAVLKRVAVPDKDALAEMRTEVETMKKLQGRKHIVQYIDSHASGLRSGGFEVFLLMEFCAGGGLIDFMNTRLQHRLTEPEILKIFGDVAQGVATMHYLDPPLLHRDLKVENVLISRVPTSTSAVLYKLCDFGSTAESTPAATNAAEARLVEYDVQRHTTMQYRSPEMVDVWRRQPIDEKSDIWALGVLLYKLCYYTTPFEEVGQMAILTASFKYPHHPPFSSSLKSLIGSMLREDPKARPNIYQVVSKVAAMTGRDVSIRDIYSTTSPTKAADSPTKAERSTTTTGTPHSASFGISKEEHVEKRETIPQVVPMRRGRPGPPSKGSPVPSATKTDPFAMLDASSPAVLSPGAVDAMAQKFPSIDDFSIAHDTHTPFKPNIRSSESPAPARSHTPSRSSSPIKAAQTRTERPIWRVPDHSRSSSHNKFSRADESVQPRTERAPELRPKKSLQLLDLTSPQSVTDAAVNQGQKIPDPEPLIDVPRTESPSLIQTKKPPQLIDVAQDNPDETKREQERLRLLAEEDRVAKAALEYRDKPRLKSPGNRASMIQMRMQSLLDDTQSVPPKRTAEGYGKYTEPVSKEASPTKIIAQREDPSHSSGFHDKSQENSIQKDQPQKNSVPKDMSQKSNMDIRADISPSVSAPPATNRPVKPTAKPKPVSLRTGLSPLDASPKSANSLSRVATIQTTPRSTKAESPPSRLAALLAKDQIGVAAPGAGPSEPSDPGDLLLASTAVTPKSQISIPDLDVTAFANRYPSINGLDMIERDLKVGDLSIKDV